MYILIYTAFLLHTVCDQYEHTYVRNIISIQGANSIWDDDNMGIHYIFHIE